MAVVLEDAVLVLLGQRPSSAYDLWHRHTRIFGTTWPIGIRRVMTAVANLERSRLLRVEPGPKVRMTSGTRHTCRLTPTGRRQQAEWLCAVTPDLGIEDIYIRGMLAVDAADAATFEAFLTSGLAATRQRMSRLSTARGAGGTELARGAFELEAARALALWLQLLPGYRTAPATTPQPTEPAP